MRADLRDPLSTYGEEYFVENATHFARRLSDDANLDNIVLSDGYGSVQANFGNTAGLRAGVPCSQWQQMNTIPEPAN